MIISKASLTAGITLAFAVAVPAAVSASGERADANPEEMNQLISQRCVTCHQLTTVTDRRASAQEWQDIVKRMVDYGAEVNEPEAQSIATYLSTKQGTESQSGRGGGA